MVAATCLFVRFATGCGTEPLPDGLPDSIDCTTCHGSVDNPAPPLSLSGSTSTDVLGVGAHQSHLKDGDLRKAISCADCHLVPETMEQEGHIDPLPAEVVFNALARADDAQPTWVRTTGTCQSVYCHGATLSGGNVSEPSWTTVDGSQAACDSCHGNPPPPPHTTQTNCYECHQDTVDVDHHIIVANETHINGVVNVQVGESCNSCHGSEDNPAPPLALNGATESSDLGVGAHQNHLVAGNVRQPMNCESCHIVPATVSDDGHIDTAPAELTFSGLALNNDTVPHWSREDATCSGVYCHGATLNGGLHTVPIWTTVDHGQLSCGSCHGYPPPAPHPDEDDCADCHGQTVTEEGALNLQAGYHINGQVDVEAETACNTCHGSSDNPAPPLALDGSSSVSEIGVGAHQQHLNGGVVRHGIACSECHKVPDEIVADGHIDGGNAELVWGELARAEERSPSWSRDDATCSNVYCHGASLDGGRHVEPIWTQVDQSQLTCGSCHGNPPPAPHPNQTACHRCHEQTVTASGTINLASRTHINGDEEAEMACNSCHGSEDSNAPPTSLSGSSDTEDVGVGAHQSHLTDGDLSQAISCSECHIVPEEIDDDDHIDDGVADISWGELATTDELSPLWNRQTETCTNTYCHGASLTGGLDTSPIWTQVDQGQAACGRCHGYPPPDPHPAQTNCRLCHSSTITEDGVVDVPGGHHINGEVDLDF